jgi:hypothetical protein
MDNDGAMDLLLVGGASSGAIGGLWQNLGAGQFTNRGVLIPAVSSGSVAWGDYDRDGFLDFVVLGNTGSNLLTRIYRNLGDGSFADSGIVLPGLQAGVAIWGDYDNDGDLDLFLAGSLDFPNVGTNRFSRLYRNDGGSFVDSGAIFTPVCYATAAWGDSVRTAGSAWRALGPGRWPGRTWITIRIWIWL